jgi:hypothetical protein
MEIEQARPEDARWKILRIVDAGRPIGVNEAVMLRVLSAPGASISRGELRRELSYLAGMELLEIGTDGDEWYAKATAARVAVVEYTTAAPAGIARPRKG